LGETGNFHVIPVEQGAGGVIDCGDGKLVANLAVGDAETDAPQ
jgi:hypothetical protein